MFPGSLKETCGIGFYDILRTPTMFCGSRGRLCERRSREETEFFPMLFYARVFVLVSFHATQILPKRW